ncbi:hypothetical protein BH23ACT7_BH23ACT7_10160 [soil metagenome]|jgi:hypothetical protein
MGTMAAGAAAQLDERLGEALRPRVRAYLARLDRAGVSVADLGGVEALVDYMVSALPTPDVWNDRIGPFYTTGQLTRMLGVPGEQITGVAVRDRRDRGTLLGCRTADGKWVYPTFQFRGRRVRDDVIGLLRQLPTDRFDGWTVAAWITGPRRDLDGASPLRWLDTHGLDDRLRQAASRFRSRAAA